MQAEYLNPENILQNMGDAFVSLDRQWRYSFINDRALHLMGKPREELLGSTLWEIFPDIKNTIFDFEFHKVMDSGESVRFETYYPSYKMWLGVRVYPHDHGISIFYTDITEKVKAHEIVEESEKWFRNVANNAPVMIWSSGVDGLCNYFNQTWLNFTGNSEEKEKGEGWLEGVFYEDLERVSKTYRTSFGQRKNFRMEYRLKFRDGSYRWVSETGKPLYAPDKSFLGYVGTCADIHDQVMMYQELENRVRERTCELAIALEREKTLNNMKSRFVSMASHEFRTPLSAVRLSAGLIESYIKLNQPENMPKHLGRIKASIQLLTDILDDFLSLERLEQGEIKSESLIFDLREVIKDSIVEVENLLKSGQHILDFYKGNNSIYSDKKIIRNILLNLLSNAIKYSEKDINLEIEVTDDIVSIVITDQGIGIPEEEQEALFSRYFRATNVGNIQGTGLGLSIVRRYVEILKGTINFTSKKDKGTRFILQFPRLHPSAEEMSTACMVADTQQ